MAVALETVVKQLEDSGIVAPGKLEQFIPPKANPKTVEELVRELVKQNHLTKFQAQQVALGKAKALILGEYTILDKIGAGGMGQVFKALHRRMERTVAIKMLPPSMTKDAAALARFQREVVAAAKLHHTNIVTAHDAGQANGVHFLVMEYVEGTDLSALVKKHGPLEGSKALHYVLQAAKGLEFAHKKGVVHRDIKPANLLLDTEGTVKILDMGLARIETGGDQATQAELTGTGAVMGTVDYMSPEQALSTKGVDARTDIYSLGCTLYYLLAGKPLYDGETITAKLIAHQGNPIPSLADVQDGVPDEVQACFAKMVAKKVEDRYQTMTEVIAVLEKIVAGQSTPSNLAPPAESTDTGLTKFFKELPTATTHKSKPKATKQVAAPVAAIGKKVDPRLVLYGSIAGGVLSLIGIPLVLYLALSGGANRPRKVSPTGATAGSSGIGPPLAVAPFDAAQAKQHQQAWAKYLGTKVETNNSIGQTMILIPPGEFQMGSNDAEVEAAVQAIKPPKEQDHIRNSERPQHRVVLAKPYRMGATEVTIGQFRKFVEATNYVTEQEQANAKQPAPDNRDWRKSTYESTDETAVFLVSWNDAVAFCDWLSKTERASYRLPTEAEWEYACRAGTTTQYSCGDDIVVLNQYGWTTGVKGGAGIHPVRMKLANPLGLFDMHGNLQEWCHDWYDERWYAAKRPDRSAGAPSGTARVVRGGSWYQYPTVARSAYRDSHFPEASATYLGFRVVTELTIPSANSTVFARPATSSRLFMHDPAFSQWVKDVQAMPAEQQLEAVRKKLMELNPGFDGKLTGYGTSTPDSPPKIENGVVVELGFITDHVENLAPLQALSGLRRLLCSGSIPRKGRLIDLSPLAGLPLTNFNCAETQVVDLAPLSGMPLKSLVCNNSQVTDLAPLAGLPLSDLRIQYTGVSDLTPLKGMKLQILYCFNTPVSDLSPLAGMPLTALNCSDSQVADLTPLKGMQLPSLWFHDTPVSDVTPLAGMSLKSLRFTPANITRGIEVLRAMTTLENLGLKHQTTGVGVHTPAEFWKKYDADEFGKPATSSKLFMHDPAFPQWVKDVQAKPANEQLDAVRQKLVDLNPGFDGEFVGYAPGQGVPKIEQGIVTELGMATDAVTDISPVRAFTGLTGLRCAGSAALKGVLLDLSPLTGLQLKKLDIGSNRGLSDLTPLRGMKLTHFHCNYTAITDLTILQGMPLTYLHTGNVDITSLSFMRGMPLDILYVAGSFSDLSPLAECPNLRHLACSRSQVTDLSPLKALPLQTLNADTNSLLSDLSPLAECQTLKTVTATKTRVTAAQVAALQKSLPDCKITWDDPAAK